jgi:hypothetical protein
LFVSLGTPERTHPYFGRETQGTLPKVIVIVDRPLEYRAGGGEGHHDGRTFGIKPQPS